MRARVSHLRVLPLNPVREEALLAVVEVEAMVTLVSHVLNGENATPIALYLLFDGLTRLHNDFYLMVLIVVMPANVQTLIGCREVTVLAQAEMRATRTNETDTNDGFHIATHALVITMSSQPIS